jgi:2-hydroxycyclohexanecarboxyl-CoA dehydrogenase
MRGLNGKRAIVTGGASGIGRATVIRLVQEGCTVGIFDLNDAGAQETIQLAAGPGKAFVYCVDIGDYNQVREAVTSFETTAGPIHLLANIAGWDQAINFLDSDVELWHKVIRINLYGPLNVQHIVLKGMADRGFGRVVSVSSDAGRVGSSGESVYSACKGGINAFTKTVARELARRGVTLNVVCPGPTDTPLLQSIAGSSPSGQKLTEALARAIPMGRLGQPDDYPGMIAFLLSDDAKFITGQTISVSGGLTMHG